MRLTYINGSLGIMTPISEAHEALKSNLGLLLETYLDTIGLRFYRRGGYTLTRHGYAAGEPDESCCLGANISRTWSSRSS